jgi:hypothetical protein
MLQHFGGHQICSGCYTRETRKTFHDGDDFIQVSMDDCPDRLCVRHKLFDIHMLDCRIDEQR